MVEAKIPADYAIDALSMEAERRRRKMGVPKYSYGQLVADTTESEREAIAEDYRQKLTRAHKKGRHRASTGTFAVPETSAREVEDTVCQKLEAEIMDMEKTGE